MAKNLDQDVMEAAQSGQGFGGAPKQKPEAKAQQSAGAMVTADDRLTDNLRRAASNVGKVESAALQTAIQDEQLAGRKEGHTLAIAHEAGVMTGFGEARTEATLQRMGGLQKIRGGASVEAAARILAVEVDQENPLERLLQSSETKQKSFLPTLY